MSPEHNKKLFQTHLNTISRPGQDAKLYPRESQPLYQETSIKTRADPDLQGFFLTSQADL